MLHRKLWPSTWDKKVSAFPLSSHSDPGEGAFSRLDYGSLLLRPVVLLALLSELTRLASGQRGRLHPGFRRFGRPRRRRISLQCQLGNLHWQDSHLLDHQLASLHYPGALTSQFHSQPPAKINCAMAISQQSRPAVCISIARVSRGYGCDFFLIVNGLKDSLHQLFIGSARVFLLVSHSRSALLRR